MQRKIPMMALGVILLAIWVTLALTKLHALVFVTVVMVVGLTRSAADEMVGHAQGPAAEPAAPGDHGAAHRRGAARKPKLLHRHLRLRRARAGGARSKRQDSTQRWSSASSARCSLSYKYDGEQKLTIDTDLAAQKTLRDSSSSAIRRACRSCPFTTPAPTPPN